MSEALAPIDKRLLALRQQLTKMKAADAFHGPGFDKLIGLLESDDPKTVIAVMNFLGKVSGDLRSGPMVAVQVKFEDLIKQAHSAGPLSQLTQITESVIDAEDDDDTDQ